jgi:hypothetical protein
MPAVSETTARAALRFGWQSGCALYACFGSDTAMAEEIDPRALDEHMLVDRALANGASMSSNSPKPAYVAPRSIHRRPIYRRSKALWIYWPEAESS